MPHIPRLRVGGRVSASAFDRQARMVEQLDVQMSPNVVHEGASRFAPELPPLLPTFAQIDDASARPIAADTPYRAHLILLDGTEIPGSDFDVWEINQDRSVPDAEKVEVIPFHGGWGFLCPQMILDFDGCCLVDEGNTGGDGTDPDTLTMTVTSTGPADVNHKIYPDNDAWLMLHLKRPHVGGDRVVIGMQQLIEWGMVSANPGVIAPPWDLDARCVINVLALTQDFDFDDDGTPATRRNTWNTKPTSSAQGIHEYGAQAEEVNETPSTLIHGVEVIAGATFSATVTTVTEGAVIYGFAVQVAYWQSLDASTDPDTGSLAITVNLAHSLLRVTPPA